MIRIGTGPSAKRNSDAIRIAAGVSNCCLRQHHIAFSSSLASFVQSPLYHLFLRLSDSHLLFSLMPRTCRYKNYSLSYTVCLEKETSTSSFLLIYQSHLEDTKMIISAPGRLLVLRFREGNTSTS